MGYHSIMSLIFNKTSSQARESWCRFLWVEFVGYFYVQTTICFVGFWLNLLCLLVFQKRHFRRVVHYFMAALAFFNLLTLLIIMPQGLMRCSETPDIYFLHCNEERFKGIRLAFYKFSIYFGFPAGNITELMSMVIIMMLTWERYQVMKGSFQYRVKPSTYVYSILSVLFLVCIVLNLPFFFVQENVKISYTRLVLSNVTNLTELRNYTKLKTVYTYFGKSNVYHTYLWLRMVVIPVIILLFITLLSILLIKVTHRSFRNYTMLIQAENETNLSRFNQRQINSLFSRRQAIELQLTTLLILLIVLFILGQFPQAFSFSKLFERFAGDRDPPQKVECRYDYKMYRMISYFLTLCTYGFPFFMYFWFDGTFRKTLMEILNCACNPNGERANMMESQETFNLTTTKKQTSVNSKLEFLNPSSPPEAITNV